LWKTSPRHSISGLVCAANDAIFTAFFRRPVAGDDAELDAHATTIPSISPTVTPILVVESCVAWRYDAENGGNMTIPGFTAERAVGRQQIRHSGWPRSSDGHPDRVEGVLPQVVGVGVFHGLCSFFLDECARTGDCRAYDERCHRLPRI
jgi:hypothetical protein